MTPVYMVQYNGYYPIYCNGGDLMARPRKTALFRALSSALAALILSLGLVAPMTGCAKKITYTLEAGSDLPSPYRLVGADGAAACNKASRRT